MTGRLSRLWDRCFPTPTVQSLQLKELAVAQVELASAQSNAEYYTAMVAYNQLRVARLQQQTTGCENANSS